jgi:hypothetical protein
MKKILKITKFGILGFLFILILSPSFLWVLNDNIESSYVQNKTFMKVPNAALDSPPIDINDDTDFSTLLFPGIGSSDNPFIIENLMIDAGTGIGIYILNI